MVSDETNISHDDARRLVRMIRAIPAVREIFDASLIHLAIKALEMEEREHKRAVKGGAGQKREAALRRVKYLSIATDLMRSRQTPFASYRQLAKAVERRCADGDSYETIRKHLSAAAVLANKTSG